MGGRIILAIAVLSAYAKKETQESQNGEAPKSVLSVGSLGVPLFRVDMNSGNKDSDFYARLLLADKMNQIVDGRITELFEESSKGEELSGTNEFYHENGLISSNTFYNENGEKHMCPTMKTVSWRIRGILIKMGEKQLSTTMKMVSWSISGMLIKMGE